jgi:hypothetical protein
MDKQKYEKARKILEREIFTLLNSITFKPDGTYHFKKGDEDNVIHQALINEPQLRGYLEELCQSVVEDIDAIATFIAGEEILQTNEQNENVVKIIEYVESELNK